MRNWRDKKPEDFTVRGGDRSPHSQIVPEPAYRTWLGSAQRAALLVAMLYGLGMTVLYLQRGQVGEPELSQQVLDLSRQVDALTARVERLRGFATSISKECGALIADGTNQSSKRTFCQKLQPKYQDALAE